MRINSGGVGHPAILRPDTKANIEALTNVAEGQRAYATDTDEPGWFDGTDWQWWSGTSNDPDRVVSIIHDDDAGRCVYIPKFTVADVAGVTFGGFVVQAYPSGQPNATLDDDNPDVADSSAVGSTKAVSRHGISPWRTINFTEARKACANIGTGWHLMTAFEWASLAYLSKSLGTMPHGPNGDTNPPSDVTYTTEIGELDRAYYARNSGYKSAATGSGPREWHHNHLDGVWGLNAYRHWCDGFFLCPASLSDDSDTPHTITGAGGAGYPLILANLETILPKAPYGESTSVAAGSLTDSNKSWTADEFIGCFVYDADGDLYYIDDNDATSLTIDGNDTPAAGPYTIVKLKEEDIATRMSSIGRILTLSTDSDLAPFAVPQTKDATGSDTYGKDECIATSSSFQVLTRGGDMDDGTGAGVFAFSLSFPPTTGWAFINFRACKAI